MNRTTKRLFAVLLAVVLVLSGGVPLGTTAKLSDWFGGLTASAAHKWQVGEIGEFGSYPQTRVTDPALLSALDAQNQTWVSYDYYAATDKNGSTAQSDYMMYADVDYGGSKYRAVSFRTYRPNWTSYAASASYFYQDDNGYVTGAVYWFKFEPISWRVLDPSTGLVMCETVVDSQAYNNTIFGAGEYYNSSAYTFYANDYVTSSVRTWLNGHFLQTAFTSAEQSKITATNLDNSGRVNDKIFLLSRNEATNPSYGFCPSYSADDPARIAQGSDYAMCQGLSMFYGNCYWWLRSPGLQSSFANYGSYYGYINEYSNVFNTYVGIRPALRFSKLSSLIFTSTEAVPVTGISLDAEKLFLAVGKTAQLTAAVEPFDATDPEVTWTSSDETVATVDAAGLVTAKSVGTVTITAKTDDGGFIGVCPVKIYNKIESIAVILVPAKVQYNYGQALDLTGLVLSVSYSDGTKSVMADTVKMTVTGYDAKKTGAQTLTVEYEDHSASFDVTVKMAWWQWLLKILRFGWIWN